MSTSKAQYHREQVELVLEACNLKPTDAHLPYDYLRAQIDELGDDAMLTAGVADFWLDLDKEDGPKQRRIEPPKSPFKRMGNKRWATKAEVAEWDLAWRARKAADLLRKSKSKRGSTLAETFLYQRFPMVMALIGDKRQVVGMAGWLPSIAQSLKVDQIDIDWLRPDQALRLPWLDRNEAAQWQSMLVGMHRRLEQEVAEFQANDQTGPATGPSREPLRP